MKMNKLNKHFLNHRLKNTKKIKSKEILAISQIFILVIGILAISYAIGSEARIVSAATGEEECPISFVYSGKSYTATGAIEIIMDSGLLLTKQYTGIWHWWSSSKQIYVEITITTEGADDYAIWMKETTKAVNCWILKNQRIKEEVIEEPPATIEIPAEGIDKGTEEEEKEEGETVEGETDEDLLNKGHTACNTKCFERGYYSGYCTETCKEEELPLGKGFCYEIAECCCFNLQTQEEKKGLLDKTCDEHGGEVCEKDEKCIGELSVVKDREDCCIYGCIDKESSKEGVDGNDSMVPILGGLLLVKETGALHSLYTGFKWAAIVYGGTQLAGSWLGLEQSLTDSLAMSFGVGTFVWQGLKTAKKPGALGWGIAATVIVFIVTYQKETQEIIAFTCQPWDADAGGNECDTCNQQGILPCSEYQCRSLGQACELVNKGTDEEKCVWINRNDVEFPTIEALDDALLTSYKYTPDNAISPPDKGVEIEYENSNDNCVPAFTPLGFGIKTNEPAKCKLDILRKDNFDDMSFYFSGGLLNTEHSYSLSLPSLTALEEEGIEIENNGEYSIYVRCQDANGNSNTANFVFNFCVDKGPDTTPPLIVGTSPLNEHPIAFGQTSFITEVYINEPAECKWSHLDQNYDDMSEMDCTNADTLISDMNNQGLYTCIADLTGLKDRQDNKFYFRCKDQPIGVEEENRNTNTESYKFSLIGTQPLVIDSVEPSDTIRDSTDNVKVTLEARTSAGYNKGESTCWYKEADEDEEDYIVFFETNSYQHSQDLYLIAQNYDYSIRCCDLGNNCDNETISFSVETDISAPIVVRAYKEETYLKIITNEPAECVYDVGYENFPCDYNFEDGIKMTTMDSIDHYTNWNTQTNFYIQCRDEYGKQPDYGECSIIVRPFEIY